MAVGWFQCLDFKPQLLLLFYHKCLYRIANSIYVIYTNFVLPLGPVTAMNITKQAVYARIGIVLCYTLGCWGGDKIR